LSNITFGSEQFVEIGVMGGRGHGKEVYEPVEVDPRKKLRADEDEREDIGACCTWTNLSQTPPKTPKSPLTIPLVPTTQVTPITEDEDMFYDCL
jgi:hypothetical protein